MSMVDLIGSSEQTGITNLGSARTLNWFLREYKGGSTKVKRAMLPIPGATAGLLVDAQLQAGRGLYTSSSGPHPDFSPRLYGTWGGNVYRMNGSLTAKKQIGNVGNTGNPVSMTDNGFVFVVVDGFSMFSFPLATTDISPNTLTAVALPEQPGMPGQTVKPTSVCFLGQRLIINSTRSNQWMFSDLPTSSAAPNFPADNFYSAESSSDPINGLIVSNGTLWVFGFRSYECWRGNDNQDDPFSFVAGSQSSIGLCAPASLASIHNQVFFLGSSDVGAAGVFMGTGTTVERISDPATEDQIMSLGLSAQQSATGWAYAWKGQMFYVLNFPSAGRTFVYETQTGTWCERGKRNFAEGTWDIYPYVYGTYIQGRIYTQLSIPGGMLCYLDDESPYDYDGAVIVRQRISPAYYDAMVNIQVREMNVDCEVGATKLLTGTGSDPRLLLEVSRDGGLTYGDIKAKSIGKAGEYRKVLRWNSLGTGRSFVMRLTFSEPCSCAVYQASLTFSTCGRT